MADRSLRPDVRNPVLGLPAMQRLADAETFTRADLRSILLDLRSQAKAKGDESLRKNKYMMFAYWRIVGVYTGHIARVFR